MMKASSHVSKRQQDIINNAASIFRMEGLNVSKSTQKIAAEILSGKISANQIISSYKVVNNKSSKK